ncbi:alkylhydroperoxidase domain protein [Bosea caraganae]|uniref:Alkylhydroperoxidase domain protein n=1 Tax=Bosea caraganae TaxID=2763117 RepID=A0A370LCM1_9HYPH|nr:alkylhydroperoxidase domain protein [Bosea caraganae]RDJ27701.1 alkylhydroperoxidase domain protein [Bosea caraganae]RDJ29714.1 alkylhydroperoxidase domain protein [Bosea caraganae]
MTATTLDHPAATVPTAFTQAELGWNAWLDPVPEEVLTERQKEGLVDIARAKSPYFRLLAHDPDILRFRTLADKDIFYNTRAGLPRAERELAAAAVSRSNGCIYCASVHSRFASTHSKRRDEVQRLLDEGVGVDIDPLWNAVIEASAALAATPVAFGAEHVGKLRALGLDDLAIADLIHAASFFSWANRLMLSLGEPELP